MRTRANQRLKAVAGIGPSRTGACTMQIITLAGRTWTLDESKPLGSPGGFGAVFRGADAQGNSVAIKRIHIQARQDAARELEITKYLAGHDHPHVIPFHAAGQDAASRQYFIVMAKAERSLADLIASAAPLPEEDAVE